MKRIFAFCLAALLCLSSNAQDRSEWSIIPHIGVNLANISDCKVGVVIVDDETSFLEGKTKMGFVVGADLEYAQNDRLGWLLGLYYAQQGCKYDTYIEAATMKEIKMSEHLHYLNLMLAPKLYLGSGFAFEAGVQAGLLLSAKNKVEESGEDDPSTDFRNICNKVAVSVPVGLSFEYQQVQLGIRYYFPLNHLYEHKYDLSSKNKQISFTVGYRFNL